MANEIKSDHEGVEITYNRRLNTWGFTLEGKDYNYESLVLAENKIDDIRKDISLKRRKQFEPIPAFYGLSHGRITSMTDETQRDWATKKDVPVVRFMADGEKGGAGKHAITELYADTPANRALIDTINRLKQEEKAVYGKLAKLQPEDLPVLEAAGPPST